MITHWLESERLPWLVLLVSVAALAFAFISQYGFDLHPCQLCIYQRWPFAITIVLGAAALLWRDHRKLFLAAIALTFVANAGIAGFHVGVEQGWWQGLSGCSAETGTATSLEELRKQIMSAPIVRCDEIAWSLFGISMAGYNVLLCLIMAGLLIRGLTKKEVRLMSEAHARPPLPGDGDRKARLAAMIRVNQAGEFGAKQIYAGQQAILGHTEEGPTIAEMAAQEQEHLDTFNEMMVEQGVRPTALTPLWRVGAFALGAGTALLGKEAAMACTVAVEEVIDDHYRRQSLQLDDQPELQAIVDKFRADELQHRDTALEHGAAEAPAYRLLTAGIRAVTRTAIALSTKI